MNINAESIQKKEFHVVFKGYKPEEVDKFLDIIAVEFDRLLRVNRELQDNLEKLKYEGDQESTEMKKVIQEALVSAHKIAEDIKQKAEKEAEDIVRTKVVEQEESYKKLLGKKLQLERDIHELNREYEGFKEKIAILLSEFKEVTSRLEEGKFLNMSGISKRDLDYEKKGTDEDTGKESREEKEIIYSSESELSGFEGTKKTGEEEKPGVEDLEESEVKEEPVKEEEEQEKEKHREIYEDSEEMEETDDDYKPKRMKKKIDIANPDIINDFFKTDED